MPNLVMKATSYRMKGNPLCASFPPDEAQDAHKSAQASGACSKASAITRSSGVVTLRLR